MLRIFPEIVYPAASLLCALAGAAYDVRQRRIPSWITLPSILAAPLLHFTLGGWRQLASSCFAGAISGLIFLAFYFAGGMGAGDVKLMTAVSCLAGLPHVESLLVFTALAGGAMAVSLALSCGRLKETIVNVGELAVHHRRAGLRPHPELNLENAGTLRLPYGLAICAGAALTFGSLIVRR